MYTQRGRLAQDDAAREIAKQRSLGSAHTWQPMQRNQEPPLTPGFDGNEEDAGRAAPDEAPDETPVNAKPARKAVARKKAKGRAKSTTRAKTTAAPAVRARVKGGRKTRAKAKGATRRKT
jgi:hypothetical protein